MAKQNWTNINLMDVKGMASNPVNPGTKFARRLLNVYAHEKPGALTLRPGYAPKYTPPSDSTLTSTSFINFAPFYDRQADPNGKEIICLIQKGVVNALKNELNQPIVENTLQGFQFWVRPYWNGSQWVNNWQWINKTIITKIVDLDVNFKSHIKIFGNTSHGLTNDSLIGWTIYNLTKNEFAKIITCKLENPNLWINISLYNNNWEIDDVLICSRCWIDINAQLEFFNNVEKEDIVFHTINNDLRIGFGGKENRPGLALGYRKFYYQIAGITFPEIHPDLEEEGAVEKFAKIDGICLDTNILDKDLFGIDLVAEPEGELENNLYSFKLVGHADYYTQQLVAEDFIVTQEDNQRIIASPFVRLGRDNIRLTGLSLYFSTNEINYYKTKTYSEIKKDTFDNPKQWVIDSDSRLILKLGSADELNDEASAVSTTNEANSFGSWTGFNLDGTFEVDTEAANQGNYSFKLDINNYGETVPNDLRRGIKRPIDGLRRGQTYTVNCYLKVINNDLFEDFEDTNYVAGLSVNGFIRTQANNPLNSWHLFGEASQHPTNTNFPYSPRYITIVNVNNPVTLEFYLIGHVTIYKKIGTGNPILIGNRQSFENTYNEASKQIVQVNESETMNVTLYILHEPDYFDVDEGLTVAVWNDCYIDNITVKVNTEAAEIYSFIVGESLSLQGVAQKSIDNATINYQKFTFDLFTSIDFAPKYLVFAARPKESSNTIFWIDEVSIKLKEPAYFDLSDLENPGGEISDEMGYTPTYNLVKGWDQALLRRGRTYYLNPFVEKRYQNYILVSHIGPPAVFMWDIASFDNFREIEGDDGNRTLAMVLLPNDEIFLLKDSSVTSLIDDGLSGVLRQPIYGVDCISKSSIVNINGRVFWCGKEEIFIMNLGNSFIPEPLLKYTIRDLYLAIEDKTRIFGTRSRFNTYRIRINDPNQKTEYLLTEDGWVEERKWHYPQIYRPGFSNLLYFLSNNGIIYEEQVDYSLPIIYYGEENLVDD